MATGLRGMAVLAGALIVSGCTADDKKRQPTEPPPFSIDEVDFTPDCAPNEAFGRLLTVLLPHSASESDDSLPEFDTPLFNAVSGSTSHVLSFATAKDWHGLRLAEVRLTAGIESGPFNTSLVFADPAERVREVWNARGWELPPVGETRVIEDEALVTAVGVEADGELAAVTCFSD